MPRRVRELIDEGIYHVFNRGNDRRQLFGEAIDYQQFLSLLGSQAKQLQTQIYHYCLMPNHFHLFLKIHKGEDLPKLMHKVQLGYARHYKKSRAFTGHIFQERFRSPRIIEESYYLQCGRYIERNPLKASLVEQADQYTFSSARYYTQGAPNPLITPNPYYHELGKTPEERQARYRGFLELEEPYSQMLDAALVRV